MHPRQGTRFLDALDRARRRLVGASLGGVLAATVLPAGLLAVLEPFDKGTGMPGKGSPLALPLKDMKLPATLASPAQRKRVIRAHPHFRVYKQAKHRYGVSWFLVAALHDQRRTMGAEEVLAAARRLRRAGGRSALDSRALKAVRAYFGGKRSAAKRAAAVLARARAWKRLGVIPLRKDGRMASPVHGSIPQCGYFHCPRPGHLHNGVDLSAPMGTPILAVQTGRVAVLEGSGQSSGYGNFVCLQHAPALASCYAHLSRFADGLELGRVISRGELLGTVGCTGTCYGPHLHFEIRRGPAACSECAADPIPYLSGKMRDVPAVSLGREPQRPQDLIAQAPAPVRAPAAVVPVASPAPVSAPAPAAAPAPSRPASTPGGTAAPTAPTAEPTAPAPSKPSSGPGRLPPEPEPELTGGAPSSPPPPPPPADPAPAAQTGGAADPPAAASP